MLTIYVEVPITCFRIGYSRQYFDTYLIPPYSTIYGMLLSCIGETNRTFHIDVKLGLKLLSKPELSIVLRKYRRMKYPNNFSAPGNSNPDYQELLTDVRFLLFVDSSSENSEISLEKRLTDAFENPSSVNRYGSLCLGESRDLVNELKLIKDNDWKDQFPKGNWVVPDNRADITLTTWVNHVGSAGTKFIRVGLKESEDISPLETLVQIGP